MTQPTYRVECSDSISPKWLPLSPAQSAIWFEHCVAPEIPRYAVPIIIELRGDVDTTLIQSAVNTLYARHPALRTRIIEMEGTPYQCFPAHTACDFPIEDCSNYQEDSLGPVCAAVRQPFNPSELCSYVRIFRFSSRRVVVAINCHHAVLDGASEERLFEEFTELYAQGKERQIPAIESDSWPQMLADAAPGFGSSFARPGQRPRAVPQLYSSPNLLASEFECASATQCLPAGITTQIGEAATALGASKFMLMLAAFGILCARTDTKGCCHVGVPIAAQGAIPLPVGLFLHALSLSFEASDPRTFDALIQEVGNRCFSAFDAAQSAHFAGDTPNTQAADALFNYTNSNPYTSVAEFNTVTIRNIQPPDEAQYARFPLTLYVYNGPEMQLHLLYQKSRFSALRAEQILQQFVRVLQQVVADPAAPVDDYVLHGIPSDPSCLPDPCLPIAEEGFPTVLEQLANVAAEFPDATAIAYSNSYTAYEDLWQQIEAAASQLIGLGVSHGDRVAVVGPSSPGFVIQLIAVWRCGAVAVPVAASIAPAQLQVALQDSASHYVLLPQDSANHLQGIIPPIVRIIEYKRHTGSIINRDCSAQSWLPAMPLPSSPAVIFFTSGTTGRPRAILGKHNGVAHFLTWQRAQSGIGIHDRCAQFTGLSFDVMLRDILLPLTAGAVLCIPDESFSLAPDSALPWLEDHRITLLHTVPSLMSLWISSVVNANLSHITRLYSAGEPLTYALVAQWRARFHAGACDIVNLYGPTETTMAKCWFSVPQAPTPGIQPVGWPIPGSQALVLAKNKRLCGVGEKGEIYIRTPHRTLGYLNPTQADAASFTINPFTNAPQDLIYATGDSGQYREDGALLIGGRTDFQVKIDGVRVEPEGVQAVLQSHPAIAACAVLAVPVSPASATLHAYVVQVPGAVLTGADLRAWLGGFLSAPSVPASFFQIQSLPLSPNGKLNRAKLLELAAVPLAEPAPSTQPQTNEAEAALYSIWQNLLGNNTPIGRRQSFFALGGSSLQCLRMLSTVKDVFGTSPPLRTFLRNPTIEGLLDTLTTRPVVAATPSHVPRTLTPTRAQERCYVLDQLVACSPLYIVPICLQLTGQINLECLKQAYQDVLLRNESLRCIFVSHPDGLAVQLLSSDMPELQLHTCTEESLWAEVHTFALAPFDLLSGPLIRAALYTTHINSSILILAMHHAVTDGWSNELLVSELLSCYTSRQQGRSEPLPAPEPGYFEVAAAERTAEYQVLLQTQKNYWAQKLLGATSTSLLPDRPRQLPRKFNGAVYRSIMPTATYRALNMAAHSQGSSAFSALFAIFSVLLWRFTDKQSNEIVVGTPVSGRTDALQQQLIGLFVNTVVLRLSMANGPSFRELITRASEATMDALAHQEVPFDDVVQAVNPQRVPGRNPLFDIMLILDAPDTGAQHVADLSIERVPLSTSTSKFDITLRLAECADGLRCEWEFDVDLYEATTIHSLNRAFLALADAAASNPDLDISHLTVLNAEERCNLLESWNHGSPLTPQYSTLLGCFDSMAASTPEATALIFEGTSVTYSSLYSISVRIASGLLNASVSGAGTVGIYLHRGIEMVAAVLGVLRSGLAYVPLDPAYPAERLQVVVQDSGMRAVIVSADLRLAAQAVAPTCSLLEVEHLSACPEVLLPAVHTQKLAYVLYTSGSTGRPKGVAVPHSALINLLLSMQQQPGITSTDRLLAVTTLSFDIAALELFLPLISGACVVLASRAEAMDGHQLARLIHQYKITMLQATPSTWRMLLECGWAGASQMKALCGGEQFPPDLAEQLLQRCASVWNLYGPTETTIWSCIYRVQGSSFPVPIGRPIANTSVYVLDDAGEPMPAGRVGELWIGGDGLANGYLNLPEQTADTFRAMPSVGEARLYRTGDLAKWREEGLLECLGRTDTQIKLRGYRIEAAEVETATLSHPAIRQCLVTVNGTDIEAELAAYIVLAEGEFSDSSVLTNALRSFLQSKLPAYMVPSVFFVLPAIPLTPNGKIDRRALKPILPPAVQPSQAVLPVTMRAASALEQQVLAIWRMLLNRQVGAEDNFFDVGGHSLLAVRLLERLAQETGVRLRLDVLFKAPTVRAMCDSILQQTGPQAWQCLVPVRTQGALPPFFCVHGIGGGVMELRDLVKYLHPERPLYGLQSAGISPEVNPTDSIEEMATTYLKEVLQVCPTGPYLLGGHCTIGGLIAYEMARQLTASGLSASAVIMLDTEYRRGRHWSPDDDLMHARSYRLLRAAEHHLSHILRMPGTKSRLKYLAATIASPILSKVKRQQDITPAHIRCLKEANFKAVLQYECPAYNGHITQIASTGVTTVGYLHRRMSWSAVTTVDLRWFQGEHQDILAPEKCQETARIMEEVMQAAVSQ